MKDTNFTRPKVTAVTIRVKPISDFFFETVIEIKTDAPNNWINFNYFPMLILTEYIQFQIAGLRKFSNTSDDIVTYTVHGMVFENPGLVAIKVEVNNEIDLAKFYYFRDPSKSPV